MQELSPLLNIGAVGFVLAWFMFRMEPRMRALEQAVDRNTKANLVLLLNSSESNPNVKTVAKTILQEIEDRRGEKS